MTKRFRKTLFWVFVVFFVIASIVIILFAQGWRFDINHLKLVKTGGIFIKTSASDAKVYVNDKFKESTSGLLSYSVLIENLTPGTYDILVYKAGFFPWNKSLVVSAGVITEAANVALFPIDPKKIKLFTSIPEKLVFLSDPSYLGVVNDSKFSIYSDSRIISQFSIPSASRDIFLVNQENPSLFFLSGNQFKSLNLQNKTTALITAKILKVNYFENKIYWLDTTGRIFKFDSANSSSEKILSGLNPWNIEDFMVSQNSNIIAVLTNQDNLKLFDNENGKIKTIASGVNKAAISPDGLKLLYNVNKEVWIYYLAKAEDQPIKEAGTKELIIEADEIPGDFFWMKDSSHVIISSGSDVIITERDGRSKHNSLRFLQGIDNIVAYNQNSQDLYFSQKGAVFKVNLLGQ